MRLSVLAISLAVPGVVCGGLLGLAATAQAALMGANGQHIAGLEITLTLATATDAAAGTTTTAYQVALGDDPGAEWAVLSFLVLRDVSEGPLAAVGSPPGWSVTPYGPFVDWESFATGSEIGEGEALAGFAYTYFGSSPSDQFYHYLVTKDGGNPFRVVSKDLPAVVPAALPEPTSLLLVGLPLMGVMAWRRQHRPLA
jgi:hypothetical protein